MMDNVTQAVNLELAQKLIDSPKHRIPPTMANAAIAEISALRATTADLQAEIAMLREALMPFSDAANMADDRMFQRYLKADLPDNTTVLGALNLTLGHIRAARTALTKHPTTAKGEG